MGELNKKKRIRVLEEFHSKGFGVLICTDVAARGLDIKGVSHVYNYDTPAEAKDYVHRIGRTARAGKEGKAITILASRDYENFGNLMKSKEIMIVPEELPEIETVRIKTDSGKSSGRFSRSPGRKQFGSSLRRESGGRSSSRASHSRGPTSRRSSSQGRSNSRSSSRYR